MLTDSTWKIGLKRLFELIYSVLTETLGEPETTCRAVLFQDFLRSGEKSSLVLGKGEQATEVKRSVANRRQMQGLSG